MICYKLFRVRRDKTLGSLFINRKQIIPLGVWLEAEEHLTKGFAFRPGWHVTEKPEAPHLSKKSRVWAKVEIAGKIVQFIRPQRQGGVWYTASRMKVLELHGCPSGEGVRLQSE